MDWPTTHIRTIPRPFFAPLKIHWPNILNIFYKQPILFTYESYSWFKELYVCCRLPNNIPNFLFCLHVCPRPFRFDWGIPSHLCSRHVFFFLCNYRKIASSNTSCLEAHAGFSDCLWRGLFILMYYDLLTKSWFFN